MSLDPNNALLLAAICVKAGVMATIWGNPGGGKTSTMPQLAKSLGFLNADDDGDFYDRPGFVSFAASYLQHGDMAGLPVKGDNSTLDLLHSKAIKLAADTPCLFVIDEINRTANSSIANELLRVCQEHMCGDLPLHSGTAIIATANPTTSDGAREYTPAAANRTAHLRWHGTVKHFIDYRRGGPGVMPELPNWGDVTAAHTALADGYVTAFLSANPLKFEMIPKEDSHSDGPWGRDICGPWASGRSWENFIKCLAVVASLGDIRQAPYADMAYSLGLALVGNVAGEFHNFISKSDLRTGSEVLDGPAYVTPKRIDILWAECMSASVEARHRNTLPAWHKCLDVYRAVIKSGFAEIPVVCLPYLLGVNKGGPGVSAIMAGDLNNQPDIRKVALAISEVTAIYK